MMHGTTNVKLIQGNYNGLCRTLPGKKISYILTVPAGLYT
jgi:hypothetical protein